MSGGRRSGRHSLAFVLPFAITALFGILWALASPVFSIPDENAHATKAIAQARGQIVGYTLPDVRHIVVDLPAGYGYSQDVLCYATHPEVDAGCAPEFGGADTQPWFNTWVGAYNPVYYFLIGWPSLLMDGSAAIYGMRIASALLCAAFVGLGYFAATSGSQARWMPVGMAFAAAPMTAYLFGAVNPNGAEVAAAVALWAALLRLLESFDRDDPGPLGLPRAGLWGIVVAAAVLLVNARALGPLWLVVVVAVCLVAVGWRATRRLFTTATSYVWIGAVAVGGLFSLGWTLFGGSLSNQAEASDAPLVNGSFLQGFAYMIRTMPDHLQQALGYFGWFDMPLPVWVYWPIVGAVTVLLVLGLAATGRRSAAVAVGVVAVALLVPALVQGYSVHQTGIIWQGRYGLFLYHGVLIVVAWLLSRDRGAARIGFLAPRMTPLLGAALAGFGLLAFALVLVRYVIGWGSPLGEMLADPGWQPPGGWPLLVAAYAAVSALLVVGVWMHSRTIARGESMARSGADA
ncbi:DUF2142 domain-containing protein [Agromyces agglutinans]|uniref:DUF2142 domain-containing protein n=1 Tax=Agromyces agglutinans TaxID=2662258 RepID=UPI0015627DE2|nr:DUF2142 domain-containing protein [Agromyces agglutinans]